MNKQLILIDGETSHKLYIIDTIIFCGDSR